MFGHFHRDEHEYDTEAQAQTNHPRQVTGCRPPATQPAGVVELDLGRPDRILSALPEEPQDLAAQGGKRGDFQGLQFGQDGRGPDRAVRPHHWTVPVVNRPSFPGSVPRFLGSGEGYE
jgi:hypothetical protein